MKPHLWKRKGELSGSKNAPEYRTCFRCLGIAELKCLYISRWGKLQNNIWQKLLFHTSTICPVSSFLPSFLSFSSFISIRSYINLLLLIYSSSVHVSLSLTLWIPKIVCLSDHWMETFLCKFWNLDPMILNIVFQGDWTENLHKITFQLQYPSVQYGIWFLIQSFQVN